MIAFFFFALATFVVPALALSLADARLRGRFAVLFPLGIVLFIGFFGAGAGLLYGRVDYGARLYAILVVGATAAMWVGMRLIAPYVRPRRFARPRLIAWLALAALVASFDTLVILDRNGWAFEGGRVFAPHESYFRPPLNNDGERNLVVINALIRHDGTPFLPNTTFTYQLFWHHAGAVFVAFVDPITRYPQVKGISLATATLFFFILFWALTFTRPALFLHRRMGPLLFFLIAAHADLFSFLWGLSRYGTVGIEADWSVPPPYLRNFSLKLVALTGPQHACLLMFVSAFLVAPRLVRGARARRALRGFFLAWSFLVSPIVTILFYGMYFGVRCLRDPRVLLDFAWMLPSGVLLYRVVFGYSPVALFTRPDSNDVHFLARELFQWSFLPAMPIAVVGAIGFVGLLLLVDLVLSRRRTLWRSPYASMLVVGGLGLNYFLTGIELRRHFAILAAFIVPFFLAEALPSLRRLAAARVWRATLAMTFVVSVGLHAYFVYCYTGKANWLDPDLGWYDYYRLNQVVKDKFAKWPILAAVDPRGIAVDLPPVMEATTSFALMNHSAVHSSLTPRAMRFFHDIFVTNTVAPFALDMGYRAIVWGPIERRVWGEATRKRFTAPETLLARVGEVALYRLEDSVNRRFVDKKPDVRNYLEWAKTLAQAGWPWEAAERYREALELAPGRSDANLGVGQALMAVGELEKAIYYLEQAYSADPASAQINLTLGIALYRLGRGEQALPFFRRAVKGDPKLIAAYNNLGAVLLARGFPDEAESWLRKGIAVNDAYQLRLNLGRVQAARHRYDEARVELGRAVGLAKSDEERVEVYLAAGDVEVFAKQPAAGARWYEMAKAIAPRHAPTHLKLGYALSLQGKRGEAMSSYREALRIDPEYGLARRALATLR